MNKLYAERNRVPIDNTKQNKAVCYNPDMGNHRAKGGFTPLIFRRVQVALQTKERRGIQWLHTPI